MLPRYKFYKLASHLIRQDTRSKEYEDVTLGDAANLLI